METGLPNGEIVLILAALVLILEAWRGHHLLARSLRTDRNLLPLDTYPSLTIIRPIKGLDCEGRENIRAALRLNYRGSCETFFVFDDRNDPAFRVLSQELEELPRPVPAGKFNIRFSGEPPPGRTGKLHAMIAALKEARGDVIAFLDSDIRPDDHVLHRLIDALYSHPTVGSAFGQVIVTSQPQTAGDAAYSILINGFYAPSVYFAAAEREYRFPFIMGQMMVLRRAALAAIGGLESAAGQLVDDMFIGQLLNRAGWQNVLVPERVPIMNQGLNPIEFWRLFVRWLSFSRSGLPGVSFKMISWRRGVVFWLGLLLAAATAVKGSFIPAALFLAAPVSIAASLNILHRLLSGRKLPGHLAWTSFGLILVAPLVYLNVFFGRRVNWRGRTYTLDATSRLATAPHFVPPIPFQERRRIRMYFPPDRERRQAA